MNLGKAQSMLRGWVQRYASEGAKRNLWNSEFSSGRWNCLDTTGGESIHIHIEKYANNGHVLDLGCGSGTISIELDSAAYCFYTGVDISDVAVQKARTRAREAGRSDRNEYCQSDILTYVPARQCDVILFGESIYYIPTRKIATMLAGYTRYLTQHGVIIVRIFDVSAKHRHVLDIIESRFKVVEKHLRIHEQIQTCVIVFRPLF